MGSHTSGVHSTAVLEGTEFRSLKGDFLWLTLHVSPNFLFCYGTFTGMGFGIVRSSFYVSVGLKVTLPHVRGKGKANEAIARDHCLSWGSW